MNKIEDNISLLDFPIQNTNSENLLVDQDNFTWLMDIYILITCCLKIYWHCDENFELDNSRDLNLQTTTLIRSFDLQSTTKVLTHLSKTNAFYQHPS